MRRKVALGFIAALVLVGFLAAYPALDSYLFYRRFQRDVQSDVSRESHVAFSNRLAQVREGMEVEHVIALVGHPSETGAVEGGLMMTYRWKNVESVGPGSLASGRRHFFELTCRSGVVETIHQSEERWMSCAVR